MGTFRLLEHTADMGIEAFGETPEELFRQAALGLRQMMFGLAEIDSVEEKQIQIEGRDREELLVGWLSEIIYYMETKGFVPSAFDVAEAGPERLSAWLSGEPFDHRRHHIEREVKAITYHQILVEQVHDGWRARLYVDL